MTNKEKTAIYKNFQIGNDKGLAETGKFLAEKLKGSC